MARDEHDREDLIAEATALVDRAAFAAADANEDAVIGFRGDGSASVFLTPDCVYHFTRTGELRRAYVDQTLYKAERGRLVAMNRARTARETSLIRRDLTDGETAAFLTSMQNGLRELAAQLREGKRTCSRQVTSGETAASAKTAATRAADWLHNLPDEITIARSPGVK
jgi:hypothetical protein